MYRLVMKESWFYWRTYWLGDTYQPFSMHTFPKKNIPFFSNFLSFDTYFYCIFNKNVICQNAVRQSFENLDVTFNAWSHFPPYTWVRLSDWRGHATNNHKSFWGRLVGGCLHNWVRPFLYKHSYTCCYDPCLLHFLLFCVFCHNFGTN